MNKRLYKSSTNKMVDGVCGGIAEYLDVDPTWVRVLYVLLTLFTAFSGIIVYVILWLIMPKADR